MEENGNPEPSAPNISHKYLNTKESWKNNPAALQGTCQRTDPPVGRPGCRNRSCRLTSPRTGELTRAAFPADLWDKPDYDVQRQRTYHLVKAGPKLSLWLRRLDHSAIFLLIAGTYTPICLNFFAGFLEVGAVEHCLEPCVFGNIDQIILYPRAERSLGGHVSCCSDGWQLSLLARF